MWIKVIRTKVNEAVSCINRRKQLKKKDIQFAIVAESAACHHVEALINVGQTLF